MVSTSDLRIQAVTAAAVDMCFVVVNWNTRDLTLQCLHSISEGSAGYQYRIIVVDNGSTDDSVDAIRREFPDVRVIVNRHNLGFAAANNIGLRECNARYVLLVNSDVVLRERCLGILWQYMEEHREVGLIAPRILNGDLTLQESCKEFPNLWNTFCRALALDSAFPGCRLFSGQLMRYWDHDDTRPVDILSGCFWMVRAEALQTVGELDERFFMYAEDRDWCRRFWNSGWPVVYCAGAEAIHFGGSSSSRQPIRFYTEMCRANLLYWRKHHGRARTFVVGGVMILHELTRFIAGGLRYVFSPTHRTASAFAMQKSIATIQRVFLSRPTAHLPT